MFEGLAAKHNCDEKQEVKKMTIQTSPLREQILQKRKKRNRKILLFLLMGAVLLAAVITAVVLLVNQPKPEQQPTGPWLKEIRPTQAGGAYSYQVTGGITAEQAQCPLPCYTFIPPAGYNQVLNAQEDANTLSYHYTDLYSTLGKEGFVRWDCENFASIWEEDYQHWVEFGNVRSEEVQEDRIRFEQQFAMDGVTVDFEEGVTPARWKLGDSTLYYGSNGETTQIIWIYENSLLSLTTTQILDQGAVLDWVTSQMDYTQAQPIYTSSLTLVRGESFQEYNARNPGEEEYYIQCFRAEGNPKLPEDIAPYDFAVPPEGFSQTTQSGSEEEVFRTPDALKGYTTRYRGEDGRIQIYNHAGSTPVLELDSMVIQGESINGVVYQPVEDVTVNGQPGFYYQDGNTSKLAWITDYLTVELYYEGQITKEELLALGESLVPKPTEAQPDEAGQ